MIWLWIVLGFYLAVGVIVAAALVYDDHRVHGRRHEPLWHLGLVVVGWLPLIFLRSVR